jgi:uncharacterized membrane protein
MKYLSISLWLLVPIFANGCNPEKPEAQREQREGASSSEERAAAKVPIPGEAEQTFSLSVPFETGTIVQGKQAPVKIGINRGANFGENVSIKVSDLPTGITLEKEDQMIAKGDTDVTLMLKAASDAALGNFTFKVTGHTTSSDADFAREIKIKVSQE